MKFLKWFLIIVGILILLAVFVGMPMAKKATKKHSPETTATYTENGMNLSVLYSSPSKKDRVVFGELVPLDHVWRTGANEPTTFETKTDLMIMGKKLPAGKYSLWTKPMKDKWSVMFNKNIPGWGVTISSGGSETTRVPEDDVVVIDVPVNQMASVMEKFTINFEDGSPVLMNLAWDQTKVSVPMSK